MYKKTIIIIFTAMLLLASCDCAMKVRRIKLDEKKEAKSERPAGRPN